MGQSHKRRRQRRGDAGARDVAARRTWLAGDALSGTPAGGGEGTDLKLVIRDWKPPPLAHTQPPTLDPAPPGEQ